MTDKEIRAGLHRIIQLTRNPNAPDVKTLESKVNEYGYKRVKCPICGSWDATTQFHSHYSRDHAPDWKVDLLMQFIVKVIEKT